LSIASSPPLDRTPITAPVAEPATAAASSSKLLDRLVLAVVWLSCAIAISPNNAEADLWGHVRYGQDALAAGALPRFASYTYTAVGHPWINHENLAELTFGAIASVAGGPGLLVFKSLLGLGLLALVARAARRQGASLTTLATVLVVVSINLTADWTVRPQLFSFAFFGLLICLLDQAFAGWPQQQPQTGWLWLTPPLIAVWANTHGGFVAGLAVLWAYLGCRGLEFLWRQPPGTAPSLATLAAVGATSGAATLLTPYGVALPEWLYPSLKAPRPEIFEWGPLAWGDSVFLPFVLLTAVAATAVLGTRRPRDFTQLVLLTVTAWQSIEHQRHIPFFALLVGFWLPGRLESFRERLAGSRATTTTRAPSRWLIGGFGLACALLAGVLASRLSNLTVERDEFPVAAVEFMDERDLHGPTLVNFNWAQYYLAARGERSPVQFDGRYDTCYPWSAIDAHFDWLLGDAPGGRHRDPASGPIDPSRVLADPRLELVLLDRRYPLAAQTLEQHAQDWTLLYQDSLAQLWGRTARFGAPNSRDYLPPSARQITNTAQTGLAAWPAIPSPLVNDAARGRPQPAAQTP
jgi:CDP-diglyceride synthetase